jgi:hypothetical protein
VDDPSKYRLPPRDWTWTDAEKKEAGAFVERHGHKGQDPEDLLDDLGLPVKMRPSREVALRDNVGETKPDTHSLDQSERHLTILTDHRNPNGEPLALVDCQFDMRTHKVTRADLANGETPDDWEGYVRIQGLCS